MTDKQYLVDIPNPHDLSGPWITVATFNTRAKADEWCERTFGATAGSIDLITTLEEEDEGADTDEVLYSTQDTPEVRAAVEELAQMIAAAVAGCFDCRTPHCFFEHGQWWFRFDWGTDEVTYTDTWSVVDAVPGRAYLADEETGQDDHVRGIDAELLERTEV